MNKERRKQLDEAIEKLNEAMSALEEAQNSMISSVRRLGSIDEIL